MSKKRYNIVTVLLVAGIICLSRPVLSAIVFPSDGDINRDFSIDLLDFSVMENQ